MTLIPSKIKSSSSNYARVAIHLAQGWYRAAQVLSGRDTWGRESRFALS